MSFIWLSVSFNWYLLQFLVNTFENIYATGLGASASDIVAYALSGLIYEKLGIKLTIAICYASSTIGGLIILFYGLSHQETWIFPILITLTKFGISCSFNVVYVAHSSLFPVLFAATAMGLCNIVARIFSSLSPLLAQMEEPDPMIIFTILTSLTFVIAFFI